MIVITGATGALNGATVEHLLKRIPADRIGVSVRDGRRGDRFLLARHHWSAPLRWSVGASPAQWVW